MTSANIDGRRSVTDDHRKHLRGSCLTDETIALAGIYSETDHPELARILMRKSARSVRHLGSAIVFPVFVPGEERPCAFRVRPDNAEPVKKNGKPTGKVKKYLQAASESGGPGAIVYYPPHTRDRGLRSNEVLYWTEGEKKALVCDQAGLATICLPGVSGWSKPQTSTEKAERVPRALHPWIVRDVDVAGRDHVIVFDADVAVKPDVEREMRLFAHVLLAAGARSVRRVRLALDGPKGIDDCARAAFDASLAAALDAGVDLDVAEARAFAAGEAHVRELVAITEPVTPLAPEAVTRAKDLVALSEAPIAESIIWPDAYVIARTGQIARVESDDDEGPGRRTIVTARPIVIARMLVAPDGSERVELAHERFGKWKSLRVERSVIRTSRAIMKPLGDDGVDVSDDNAKELVAFLRAFEETNERVLPRIATTHQTGWHESGGTRDFLLPNPVAGAEVLYDGDDDAVRSLGCGGTQAGHEALLRRALDECDESTVAVCASLAAPLVRIVELADSFAVHLRGDSSKGKSTMLKVAASVWGGPSYTRGFDQTLYALTTFAAARNDLPAILDEVGAAKRGDELDRTVYSLCNGRAREQGRRDGSLRRSRTWRTTVLTSGETSLVPDDSGPAGMRARVLNVAVDGFGRLDAAGVDRMRTEAAEHFGHFGRAWVEHLRSADWSELKAEHVRMVRTLASGASGIRARQASSWATLALAERLARNLLGMPAAVRVVSAFSRADADNETRPVGELALERTADWFAVHRSKFPTLLREVTSGRESWRGGHTERERGREVFGYVADSELWVLPEALRAALEAAGFNYRLTLSLWSQAGVIVSEPNRAQSRRRVDGERRRVVVLRGAHVGLDREDESEAWADPVNRAA